MNDKEFNGTWIDEQYCADFFDKLYKFKEDITAIPDNIRKAFTYRENIVDFIEAINENYPKYHPIYLFLFLVSSMFLFIFNIYVAILPKYDVNRYLHLFDLIKLNQGYVLDYKYYGDQPIVYLRRKTFIKHIFCYDTIESFDMNNLYFEKSPKGFFQYVVFMKIINQFYLYWHATFDDFYFIYSKKQIEDTLKDILKRQIEDSLYDQWENYHDMTLVREDLPERANQTMQALFNNRRSKDDVELYLGPLLKFTYHDEKKKTYVVEEHWIERDSLESLFNASLNPLVKMVEDDTVIVKLLTFTTRGGFQYLYTKIKYPNSIVSEDIETVLEYHANALL